MHQPKLDAPTRDDIDLNGSKNILDCALQGGVKNIVFASSGRVYGDLQKEGGMHDRDGNYLNPRDDFYARNKIKAEEMFLKAGDESGIRVAVLRLAIVCWKGGGAGMGDMFKSASKTGRFLTLGDKNPPIQLVHVNDVIDACDMPSAKKAFLILPRRGPCRCWNLFSEAAQRGGKKASPIKLPEKITLGVVSLLWKLKACPIPPLYLKMYGYDITRDLSKTIAALGKPQCTIQQILKEIVEG